MMRVGAFRSVAVSAVAVWCMATIQAAPAPDKVVTKSDEAVSASKSLTSQARRDAIRRAQVWTATDIGSMDVKIGPQGPQAFESGETVTCDYVKRPHGSGSTPKFECALTPEQALKVRYGDHNGEVYAQVAATRLLWALGFGANRMYPVKVMCRGCSQNPWDDPKEADPPKAWLFDPATIDAKMAGKTLETKVDEGWAWKELDVVDEASGGAPRAQRDALKLLAVLMQHTDSKESNQRILCRDKQWAKDATQPGDDTGTTARDARDSTDTCAHPLMMLTDVGKTFGHANAFNRDEPGAVNFKEWSKTPIWKDPDKPGCEGNLPGSWSGTLDNPRIGEGGRKFLADLLAQLTDSQLHDLFDVARFTRRDPSATIADWVNAFKEKRAEIVTRTCSS